MTPRITLAAGLCVGAATGCITVTLAAAPARDAFGVGVLRRDGIVIPFAAFDGKRWSANWAPPQSDLTVPIDVRGIPRRWWGPTPALVRWQAWTAQAPPVTVDVSQPDWIDAHCVRQIGLRTDYRSPRPVPPPTEQPYPKDGLVVSPPQPIEQIDILSVAAPEVARIATDAREAFNRAERLLEERGGHPITRRAREGIEPTIEAVYKWGRVYYVEASRAYRKLGQSADDCAAFAFGTGWFTQDDSGRLRSLTTVVDLLRCDRFGAAYMLPLGGIRVGDRRFWLAQFSGWDHERFVVVELMPKSIELRINVWGGGC